MRKSRFPEAQIVAILREFGAYLAYGHCQTSR